MVNDLDVWFVKELIGPLKSHKLTQWSYKVFLSIKGFETSDPSSSMISLFLQLFHSSSLHFFPISLLPHR